MHHETSIREALEQRIAWAHACLVAEVADGRARGYLQGAALEGAPSALAIREAGRAASHDLARNAFVRLGLTDVEQDVVWLLACCEIDPALSRMVEVANDGRLHQLSRQQVQRILAVPGATLDRLVDLRIAEVGDRALPAHRRAVRLCDRVLDLISGSAILDPVLAAVANLRPPQSPTVEASAVLGRGLVQRALVVAMGGPEDASSVLFDGLNELGLRALEVHADRIPAGPAGNDLVAVIARECALLDVVPVFIAADVVLSRGGSLEPCLARFQGAVLATSTTHPTGSFSRSFVCVEMPPLAHADRQRAWRQSLVAADSELVDACARRFRVSGAMIEATARAAAVHARRPDCVELADVQRAMRDLLEHRIAGLARRVEWQQRWTDLVLPADQIDLLIELIARVRHRDHVLDTWGFGAKVGKGHGVAALLSGPPGTGKTMIAGLIAAELGLDLYQVDLSRVVSKYIGETEKQLAALFDAAESGQAMLLFDEADSLFGKRTEVKSSNDRYANLEVNYLLQRIEASTGVCVLTTNHENAIDEAFMRRLALHVRVPIPDVDQRAKLWRSMLPEAAAIEAGIEGDFATLARDFVMTGGHIKNAVLRAAYLAADEGGPIRASHLRSGARSEYEAIGKLAA